MSDLFPFFFFFLFFLLPLGALPAHRAACSPVQEASKQVKTRRDDMRWRAIRSDRP